MKTHILLSILIISAIELKVLASSSEEEKFENIHAYISDKKHLAANFHKIEENADEDAMEAWRGYLFWISDEWPTSIYSEVPSEFAKYDIEYSHSILRSYLDPNADPPDDCSIEIEYGASLRWAGKRSNSSEELAFQFMNMKRYLKCYSQNIEAAIEINKDSPIFAINVVTSVLQDSGLRRFIDDEFFLYAAKALAPGKEAITKRGIAKHMGLERFPDKEYHDLVELIYHDQFIATRLSIIESLARGDPAFVPVIESILVDQSPSRSTQTNELLQAILDMEAFDQAILLTDADRPNALQRLQHQLGEIYQLKQRP